MAMPVELPDEMARRLKAVADSRGVRPEQVVMDALRAEVGSDDDGAPDDMFSSVREELREIAFDGTLRSEIDSTVDDPGLAVG